MVGIKNAVVGGASLAALAQGHALNKRAAVADGTIYTSCTTPGVVALTFDDGPHIYTQGIVDKLTNAGHKATFFQNGDNYGDIYQYGPLLNSMLSGGHQIASHTWNHADLATLDEAAIESEMNLLEAAHLSLIGKAPTYMRPPYLSTNALAVATLTKLGFKIISVDIDTQDFTEGPLGEIQLSIDWYEGNQTAGGTLSLNHDPYQATAETFVPEIIKYLDSKGLKSVPVGQCLGDAPENWYRGGVAKPPASASASAAASAAASASGSAVASAFPSAKPSGNGTAPAPSVAYPSGYPKPTHKPGKKPCGGGDTEPGHGKDAGRGALPGKKGTGDDGFKGTYGSIAGTGWTESGPGSSGTSSYGSGSASNSSGYTGPQASGTYTGPLSNGATALTGSALALCGAALIAFLL